VKAYTYILVLIGIGMIFLVSTVQANRLEREVDKITLHSMGQVDSLIVSKNRRHLLKKMSLKKIEKALAGVDSIKGYRVLLLNSRPYPVNFVIKASIKDVEDISIVLNSRFHQENDDNWIYLYLLPGKYKVTCFDNKGRIMPFSNNFWGAALSWKLKISKRVKACKLLPEEKRKIIHGYIFK